MTCIVRGNAATTFAEPRRAWTSTRRPARRPSSDAEPQRPAAGRVARGRRTSHGRHPGRDARDRGGSPPTSRVRAGPAACSAEMHRGRADALRPWARCCRQRRDAAANGEMLSQAGDVLPPRATCVIAARSFVAHGGASAAAGDGPPPRATVLAAARSFVAHGGASAAAGDGPPPRATVLAAPRSFVAHGEHLPLRATVLLRGRTRSFAGRPSSPAGELIRPARERFRRCVHRLRPRESVSARGRWASRGCAGAPRGEQRGRSRRVARQARCFKCTAAFGSSTRNVNDSVRYSSTVCFSVKA